MLHACVESKYFQDNTLHNHLSYSAKLNKIHLTDVSHPRIPSGQRTEVQFTQRQNAGYSALGLLWLGIRIPEGPGPDSDEMTFTTEHTHPAPAAHLGSIGQIRYGPVCLTDRKVNVFTSVCSASPLSPNKTQWKCFRNS